ncbi:MAG: glycerol-3-phosphate acyltransferase, partial [Sphingomonadaceae bacterium]
MDDRAELLRRLPAVGVLLEHPTVKAHATQVSASQLARAVREAVADERARRLDGQAPRDADALAEAAVSTLARWLRPHLKRVVNATGVVLNTNLGRAPLAKGILGALSEVAGGYSNLELDLESGTRGSRYSHVDALLCHLTGAEAALIVNNCAAAVLLARMAFPDSELLPMVAALAAFIGHLYPVWLGFAGGKGVATLIGVATALHWPCGLAAALLWLAMLALVRISSVAGMTAALAPPVTAAVMGRFDLSLLFIILALLILWKHRGNIERLLAGT